LDKTILLVDGNSIAHANHNGTVLTVGGPTGMQVQAIYGFLRSMRALLQATSGEKELIVLWDGKAQWRLDIFPGYKGNRTQRDAKQEAHHQAFKKQMPVIEKALQLLGVRQMRSPLLEADDLAKHLVELLSPKYPIQLVSGDQDWLQLVRYAHGGTKEVTWFDPIRDRRVHAANFFESTGFMSTAEFVEGKCLQGDDSDNIPGIEGIGPGTAQKFMAKWQSIDRFFAAVDSGRHTPAVRKSKTAKSLHPEQLLSAPEGRAMMAMNRQLMDMTRCRRPDAGEMVVSNGPGSKAGFVTLCERLAFASILRELGMFLRNFPNCK
jgi:DNA polymerase-1